VNCSLAITPGYSSRVTMTPSHGRVQDLPPLEHDSGFHEVGFAPVTSSANRLYSIGVPGMNDVFSQFGELAQEYLSFALRANCTAFPTSAIRSRSCIRV